MDVKLIFKITTLILFIILMTVTTCSVVYIANQSDTANLYPQDTTVVYGHRTGSDGTTYVLTDTGWRNQ